MMCYCIAICVWIVLALGVLCRFGSDLFHHLFLENKTERIRPSQKYSLTHTHNEETELQQLEPKLINKPLYYMSVIYLLLLTINCLSFDFF